MMEFKIIEAEVREMAKLEEKAGCAISAGADWGMHFDRVMELALDRSDSAEPMLRNRVKFIDLLSEQFGDMLSVEEIEEVAASFQMQIQERLASKVTR
jgi:hypothetical protein